jgi:hypothetical protein
VSSRCLFHVTDKASPSDPIIKLKVKTQAGGTEVLNVHRGVLCKSSGFFQRAMKPEWIELREQLDLIDLSDDSVQTVSDYIKWLYSNNMPIKLYEASEDTRDKMAEEAEKVFVVLAEAYVFGEKIVDVQYKNAVAKAIRAAMESSRWNMGPNSVNIIYMGTPSTSPLRRLVADSVACLAFDDSDKGVAWISFLDAYPREALLDAIKATVKVRRGPQCNTDRCIDLYLEEEKEG